MRTTAARKPRNDYDQHLLDRTEDLFGDLSAALASSRTTRDPFGDERLDVRR